ncbi:oligosaccharide flippase family protein [Aurantiacibacter rhizosphaerae]|uniref:Oligosaccharide flippase family protein n=1 Tax=Aurantiacibacter rhizosphaerae TaxID=2691582 RepID=A0A844XIB2_9SPHN|nr:oligosaccharide flippase family protein [Aurantiacibacter rhizosphaerae]MWV29459.1 oligosaccharide flippase family protein [Aurantiacibacter rhizosphaerae]
MRVGGGIRAISVNGLGSTGVTAAETLVRAIYFLAITRLLGPEGYGLWSWALALYGFVLGGASLGFETLVPIAYGKGNDAGDRQASRLLFMRIGISLCAIAGLAFYGWLMFAEDVQFLAILAVAPALAFRGAALLNRAIFTGRMKVRQNIPNVLAGRLAELFIGLALIAGGAGILHLLILHWLCWALEAVFSWRALRKNGNFRASHPDRAAALSILRKGAPLGALDLMSGFMMAAPLVMYEPRARNLAELGQIAIAVQLSGFLLAVGFAFLNSAVPVVAQSHENKDRRLAHYGWLIALGALGTTLALVLVWEHISATIFNSAFGGDYELGRQLTTWTILIAGAVMLPQGFQHLLLLENRLRVSVLAGVAGTAVVVLGFLSMHTGAEPSEALQVVLSGWLVRAAVLVLAGSILSQKLASEFSPE